MKQIDIKDLSVDDLTEKLLEQKKYFKQIQIESCRFSVRESSSN